MNGSFHTRDGQIVWTDKSPYCDNGMNNILNVKVVSFVRLFVRLLRRVFEIDLFV